MPGKFRGLGSICVPESKPTVCELDSKAVDFSKVKKSPEIAKILSPLSDSGIPMAYAWEIQVLRSICSPESHQTISEPESRPRNLTKVENNIKLSPDC